MSTPAVATPNQPVVELPQTNTANVTSSVTKDTRTSAHTHIKGLGLDE